MLIKFKREGLLPIGDRFINAKNTFTVQIVKMHMYFNFDHCSLSPQVIYKYEFDDDDKVIYL